MQHKRLIIDANILIRAVLGSRVRHLIEYYCESVAFYMAEANAKEAEFYLSAELAAKRNLNEEIWRPVFIGILNMVQIIADDVLIEVESKAKARITSRDVNDWSAVPPGNMRLLSINGSPASASTRRTPAPTRLDAPRLR